MDGANIPIMARRAYLIFGDIEGKLDVPKSLLPQVHRLSFEPEHPEFSPRTMWSLSNTFASAFTKLDPRTRLPWFGPDMSAASSLTARIMETWAHTQDIADALGVTREPTSRLRHGSAPSGEGPDRCP